MYELHAIDLKVYKIASVYHPVVCLGHLTEPCKR